MLGNLLLAAEEHAGVLLVEGGQAGVGSDAGRDREPAVRVEARAVEGLQDLPPGPVVAVAQADALALVQNRRRSLQVGLGQVLDLDADHVLAAEGGGDRLGEAPR